MDILQSKLKTS
jgi:hypothetical protein